MKLSLDSIGYGGYFTARGEQASLEETMKRAARFGYGAVCVYARRPIGFPLDFDAARRKGVKDFAVELGIEIGGVVCCTNFQEGNHVLLYPQEKEIMYVKAAIDFANDLGSGIVRVLAAFHAIFRIPTPAPVTGRRPLNRARSGFLAMRIFSMDLYGANWRGATVLEWWENLLR